MFSRKKAANYQANVGKRQLDKSDPINDGLIAYWSFDNNSIAGTRVNDQSGTGNTATLTGSPTIGTGLIQSGQGVVFNGGSMKATTSMLVPTTNFTISMWVNTAISGANNRPFGADNTSTGNDGTGVIMGLNANKVYIVARQGSNVGTFDLEFTPTSYTGTHHLLYTVGPGGLRAYWDGVSIGVNTNTTLITCVQTICIGADGNQSGSSFTGTVDDVRIWKRVLSAAEAARVYADQTGSLGLKPIFRNLGPHASSLQLDTLRASTSVGTPTVVFDPRAYPVNLYRNALVRNASFSEDETVDDDQVRKSLYQFRQKQRLSYILGSAVVGVSKFLEFDVLAPPDNAVDVSKALQFDVLAPPDNAVDVAKALQFVVIETLPSVIRPMFLELERRIIQPWAEFDETDFNREPLVRRLRLSSTFIQNASPTLDSVAAIPAIGTLTVQYDGSITLSGVPATGDFGSLTIEVDVDTNLIGLEATGEIGDLITGAEINIDGLEASGELGDVTVATDGRITIVGRSSTASVGTLVVGRDSSINLVGVLAASAFSEVLPIVTTPGTDITLTGVETVSAIGLLTRESGLTLVGLSATGQIGIVNASTSETGMVMTEFQVIENPQLGDDDGVTLRYSVNGGLTWSQGSVKSLGTGGDYSQTLQWRNQGIARSMLYELVWSSNFRSSLGGASVVVDIAET